jgi:geranylgeranylglycerol-phosphate geranylgeranyltransferase
MMSGFFKLVRIEHALFLSIAVIIGETIAIGGMPILTPLILLSIIVPALNGMAAFALNDYVDVRTDKINKRTDRPLVSGEIKPSSAIAIAVACYAASIVGGFFINAIAFVIVLIFSFFSIAYNLWLKDRPLVGNIYVASTMGIPFIFGSIVVSQSIGIAIIVLSSLGFISGFGREIVKSIQDMKGDRMARRSRTLPFIVGKRNAAIIASFLYFLFLPLTALPFFYGLKSNLLSILLIFIADISFLYMALRLPFDQKGAFLKRCRNLSLIALFIGLIGLLLASL